MATLFGNEWKNVYKQLLQLESSAISSTLQYILDGSGTSSKLKVSSTGVTVDAANITINNNTLAISGNSTINGSVSGTISGNLTVASGKTLSCSNTITLTGSDNTTYNFDNFTDSTAWTSFSPTLTGVVSSINATATYKTIGKTVHIRLLASNNQDSGTNALTLTNLPFTSAQNVIFVVPYYVDNSDTNFIGSGSIASGTTTVTFNTANGGAWSAGSGSKGVSVQFMYERT